MYVGSHAQTQPDKIAVLRPSTGEALTYRGLDRRSNQLAQLLYARTLHVGDHLALFSDNNVAFIEVLCACMRAGLYLTTINSHLSPEEAAYIVDDCDARALVASAVLEQSTALGRLSPQCNVKLSIGGAIAEFEDYDAALVGQPATKLAEERLGGLMLYSSGTTGRPKGILNALTGLTPDRGASASHLLADIFGLNRSTIFLSPAPLYHAAPTGFAQAVIQAGGTIVLMDRFDAETALALIERYRITHSQWVPTMFIRMLKLPDEVSSRYDLSSMCCAIHAAAPCPIEVKQAMIKWWGPILEEYYASTEGAGFAHVRSDEWLRHPGTVGRARSGQFHVCDEQGNELPLGASGLIYGESPTGRTFVYHKDRGKTVASKHPTNPKLATVGDIGYLNEEGYLFLTDRKAFMIISGGVNIYPQQIENALALHPKIRDVAVIGVPHEELGEEVKAVIEPEAGVEPSTQLGEEIKDFVRERLGKQLTPRSVDFVQALPRLPSGKLYKQSLRDFYWGKGPPATILWRAEQTDR
jgi:fatty-acyl-CoA synthase